MEKNELPDAEVLQSMLKKYLKNKKISLKEFSKKFGQHSTYSMQKIIHGHYVNYEKLVSKVYEFLSEQDI